MACQHEACQCADASVQREGRNYCSNHCAEAESPHGGEAGCACGHDACEGGQVQDEELLRSATSTDPV
jgi:hypothetical protein